MAAKSAIADINPVPSGSMEPTVLPGDVVFVNKLAYDLKVPFTTTHLAHWADPARGDVVVCFSPDDGTRLIKRVVAEPGDTIELRNETLLINGQPLAYSPLSENAAGVRHLEADERRSAFLAAEKLGRHDHAVMVLPRLPALRTFGPISIPAGSYFVMGDNRDNSHDSRFFGVVARDQIVGRAQGVFVSADLHHWLKPRFDRFFSALD
jgi:signal peptidase I